MREIQSLDAIQIRGKGVLTKLTEEQLWLLSNSLYFLYFYLENNLSDDTSIRVVNNCHPVYDI